MQVGNELKQIQEVQEQSRKEKIPKSPNQNADADHLGRCTMIAAQWQNT